jgi:phosphoesterase RecJ-like protein
MGRQLTIIETADWLRERDNYLILTHRRPDGDTVGCAGALAQGLREIGKTAYILDNPEITPRYSQFVDDCWVPDGFKPDHVIIVDTATYDLFPKNGDKYKDTVSLCIDHHPSNPLYAEYNCMDVTTASCGEVIYEILIALSGSISEKSAERLYVAVSTDSGCFAFANTTANTLRVASLLVEAGAPNRKLNRLLFRTKTRARMKIESMIVAGLELHFDGKVAISSITNEMMAAANADEDDVDDIASMPGTVEGVLAGITIREMTSTQDCKVSVRTSPLVDAHAISEHFGGGGHQMASGFSLEKSIPEIKELLLEVLKKSFPNA